MRRNARLATLSLIALLPAALAWSRAGESLSAAPDSRLWIDGKSTVRKFSCKATAFTVDVDAAAGAVAATLAGDRAVTSVNVTVPVDRIDCGNGTMNEHMLKALKAKDAPTIAFKLSSYDVAKGSAGVQGTLTGTLTVGGTTKTITVPAHAIDGGAGLLKITGAYELHMTQFGLKPPTLMMGTLKVDEAVVVNFDIMLRSSLVASA